MRKLAKLNTVFISFTVLLILTTQLDNFYEINHSYIEIHMNTMVFNAYKNKLDITKNPT